ncbi:MAG: hypothetical protein II541_08020, partial [Prevotella sp.]|nr:hypothetical protein [Prevotella sp.]
MALLVLMPRFFNAKVLFSDYLLIFAKYNKQIQYKTMKRTFITIVFASVAISMSAQSAIKPAIPRDAAIEKKIEKTLSKMTLDDKVGQMLELNLDIMGKMVPSDNKMIWQMNETMVDTCIS